MMHGSYEILWHKILLCEPVIINKNQCSNIVTVNQLQILSIIQFITSVQSTWKLIVNSSEKNKRKEIKLVHEY